MYTPAIWCNDSLPAWRSVCRSSCVLCATEFPWDKLCMHTNISITESHLSTFICYRVLSSCALTSVSHFHIRAKLHRSCHGVMVHERPKNRHPIGVELYCTLCIDYGSQIWLSWAIRLHSPAIGIVKEIQ